jgi:hypothetical protein
VVETMLAIGTARIRLPFHRICRVKDLEALTRLCHPSLHPTTLAASVLRTEFVIGRW